MRTYAKLFFVAAAVLLGVSASLYLFSVRRASESSPSTTPQSEGDSSWKTYTQRGMFTLSHPSDFVVRSAEGLGGAFLDVSLVRIGFPEEAFADEETNYGEAYIVVSMSDKPDIVAACTAFTDIPSFTDEEPIMEKTVNGVVFATKSVMEAAAGNLYNSEVYRTLRQGKCYELSLTVHTGNIFNYDPPIQEFDQQRAFVVLEKIANSFRFIE